MADGSTNGGGKVEYEFCQLCKLNHTDGGKHVYSKRHKEILNRLMGKFYTKIEEAKSILGQPRIEKQDFEPSVNIWCYCCKCEVPKHACQDSVVVCNFGFLQHLMSMRHFKKLKSFWWENRMDRNAMDKYLLTDEEFSVFCEKVLRAKEQFQENRNLTYQQQVAHILHVEASRKALLTTTSVEEQEPCSSTHLLRNNNNNKDAQVKSKGNIFTGMVPPWLQEEETNAPEIGPTLEDYQKHLNQIEKKKLPANRVGANFDRSGPSSKDWLPLFGQVWNNGRRTSSKRYERKRKKLHDGDNGISRRSKPCNGTSKMSKYVL